MSDLQSRQVAWVAVYDLVAPLLGDPHLIPGTPSWCELGDDDPAKWAALLWPCLWWVIAEDARQTAMAEASRAISSAFGSYPCEHNRLMEHRRGGKSYIPRRTA